MSLNKRPPKGAAVRLVPTAPLPDVLEFAEQLLERAQSGEVVGLAIVVTLRNRKFFVDVLGNLVDLPHETRGYVAALDDHLREQADCWDEK